VNLVPLDLVFASALAWAGIFYNRLPTSLYRDSFFTRPVLALAGGWLLVAAVVPWKMAHLYLPLVMGTWWAGSLLRRDYLLRGRMWLAVVSALGVSVGFIFIIAATPNEYPARLPEQWVFLASRQLGGAVLGLAATLWWFTRLPATRAGMPVGLVATYARLLASLILLHAVVRLFDQRPFFSERQMNDSLEEVIRVGSAALCWLLLVPAWAVMRTARGPTPSTSGASLQMILLLGFFAELFPA
jgi:hypothetical protein